MNDDLEQVRVKALIDLYRADGRELQALEQRRCEARVALSLALKSRMMSVLPKEVCDEAFGTMTGKAYLDCYDRACRELAEFICDY